MKSSSVALAAFLGNSAASAKETLVADLYTFALIDGQTLRYSGWTTALTVPAASFPAGSLNASAGGTFVLGPPFGRSKVSAKIGVEPSELDIEVFAGPDDLIGTLPFATAVRSGMFDGATVELDRLFSAPQANGGIDVATLGCLIWFYGRVAEADAGRSSVVFKVKSLLDLIAVHQFPRRIYQPSCTHVFGGAMCGYNRSLGQNALGASTGVGALTRDALSGSTQILINASASVPASYVEGTVTGASGANNGISRTIVSNGNGSQIETPMAFPYPIAVGDAFTLLPGCDHTAATCTGTFNNFARFGGFPNIPPPESAV